MPNAIHFPFEVYEMNGLLYLAIGSPNSSILEILGQAFDEGNPDSAYFLLPKELGSTDYPFSYWSWNGITFEFQISDDRMPKEWFLLFSNNLPKDLRQTLSYSLISLWLAQLHLLELQNLLHF